MSTNVIKCYFIVNNMHIQVHIYNVYGNTPLIMHLICTPNRLAYCLVVNGFWTLVS